MNFNHLHSAILRSQWLLDKPWADAQMPLVMRLLNGEAVDFNLSETKTSEDEKNVLPVLVAGMAATSNIYNARPYSDVASLPDNSVIVYSLSGPMIKRGGMCAYGMVDHAAAISRFGNSPNISGIILSIDSPGGQADGTAMLADVIKNVAANKPVLAMIDDGMAASAAMWIASAANEIYVTQATDQVGSIGVYTSIADWNAHYRDHFKLPVTDVYAPQSTDKNGSYRKALAGDVSAIEDDLSVLADQFINTVAANRGTRVKGDAWKTGKMFYAKDAQKVGLIDGQKSFSGVVDRMNVLISDRKKKSSIKSSNNMSNAKKFAAFAAVMSWQAGWESTAEGVHIQEQDIVNLDAALVAGADAKTKLDAANASIAAMTAELNTLKTSATAAGETIAAQKTTIEGLEAQVKTLGKSASGKGSTLKTAKDETAGEEGNEPSYAKADHPANEWADKQAAKKSKTDYSKLINV